MSVHKLSRLLLSPQFALKLKLPPLHARMHVRTREFKSRVERNNTSPTHLVVHARLASYTLHLARR